MIEIENKHKTVVKKILRLWRCVLDEEIVFVFDFLVELFKYAETNDENAISLGTHLVNEFY